MSRAHRACGSFAYSNHAVALVSGHSDGGWGRGRGGRFDSCGWRNVCNGAPGTGGTGTGGGGTGGTGGSPGVDASSGNDGALCTTGAEHSCHTGPPGTDGVGVCHAGSEACVDGTWGPCTGEVVPAAEVCNNLDDDCNGIVDDGVGCISWLEAR
jgi:hypothetical protein